MTATLTHTIRTRQDLIVLFCYALLPCGACIDATRFLLRVLHELQSAIRADLRQRFKHRAAQLDRALSPILSRVCLYLAQFFFDLHCYFAFQASPTQPKVGQDVEWDCIDPDQEEAALWAEFYLDLQCEDYDGVMDVAWAEEVQANLDLALLPWGEIIEEVPAPVPMPSAARETTEAEEDARYDAMREAEAERMNAEDTAYNPTPRGDKTGNTLKSLQGMTVKELRRLCKEHGVATTTKTRKPKLVKMLWNYISKR